MSLHNYKHTYMYPHRAHSVRWREALIKLTTTTTTHGFGNYGPKGCKQTMDMVPINMKYLNSLICISEASNQTAPM